jgi:hypothetical protein
MAAEEKSTKIRAAEANFILFRTVEILNGFFLKKLENRKNFHKLVTRFYCLLHFCQSSLKEYPVTFSSGVTARV